MNIVLKYCRPVNQMFCKNYYEDVKDITDL